jgi:hypothetical protein
VWSRWWNIHIKNKDQEGIVAPLFENSVFQINAKVEGHTRPQIEM